MHPQRPPTPWPRLGETWWVDTLAVVVTGLYVAGFVLRLRCQVGGQCGGALARLVDLDAVGGLPRLLTTALLSTAVVLAVGAARRRAGRAALWWAAIATPAAVLAVLKALSVHSATETESVLLTLAGSPLLAVVSPSLFAVLGRRWRVGGSGALVVALVCYAVASIGLDAATSLVTAVQIRSGALTVSAGTFVEELGEALMALVLLVTVRWNAAGR